jgi:uncharacterized cofD-like protein
MMNPQNQSVLRRAAKWLYPGMGVKRWALVIGLSALVLIIGLMGLIGRENLKHIYGLFTGRGFGLYALIGGLLLVGLGGIVLGVNQLVRSIIRGVSPEFEGRASEVIYSKRLLSRGLQIVAIGGGTGLSTLLRGLKGLTANLTAVVTVTDDGGSSGRLRREMNILPPGDIRNCLIALAEDESKMAQLFQHRFGNGAGKILDGHSLGNLVLAGLQEMTGSFDRAIEELSSLLNVRGQVLPATLEDIQLQAEMADGTLLLGECEIVRSRKGIMRLSLSRPQVPPYPKVLAAIRAADLVILGPGSLFTSIIPNLLVEEVAQEIERSRAIKFYISNLMTQPGETEGFTLRNHLDALNRYCDLATFDYVIANRECISEELLRQYRMENAIPVVNDVTGDNEFGMEVIEVDLLDLVELEGKLTVKHHPQKLARTIVRCARRAFAERLRKF